MKRLLCVALLLTGCRENTMNQDPWTSQDLTAFVKQIPALEPTNQCEDVYRRRQELGGCYLSRSQPEDIAMELSRALQREDFAPTHQLRQDFVTWSQSLKKGGQTVSFNVDSLANATERSRMKYAQDGYASFTELALIESGGK